MDLETETDQGSVEFTNEKAGDIRFEKVSFRHAGRPATLQELSVTIPARRITVLAGDSGCGKSTFLALLQRLYLPETGRIFIGHLDIRYFTLESLRGHLAVVPQQSTLLSGTVLDNLAPGTCQPDMERLLRICQEVGATEFIEKLPQGFFTYLNENGANLSGGQRQRLILARALYLDAPILLLDEPSSALDAPAEQALMDLLGRLRAAGKTILLVAHSPRLFAIADQIVTLRGGGVESVVACTAGVSSRPAAPPPPAAATAAA
jgi:ATP-binding cassette subfamily B protein